MGGLLTDSSQQDVQRQTMSSNRSYSVLLLLRRTPSQKGVYALLLGRRDVGLISGSGRSRGEEKGNPLQCSCLENPVDTAEHRDGQGSSSVTVAHLPSPLTNCHAILA